MECKRVNAHNFLLTVLVALLSTDAAMAFDDTGWCAGVTGTPVIACDDFDDYCPDPPCDDATGDDSPSQAAFLAVWPSDGCHTDPLFPPELPINAVVVGESVCEDPCVWDSRPCPGTSYCGISGPFSLRQTEGADYPFVRNPPHEDPYIFYGTSHRHDLVPRIEALNSAKGSVNGTDADPLVLEYVLDVWGNGVHSYGAAQVNRYIELTDGDDRAPAKVVYQNCIDNKWRPKVARENGKNHSAIAIGIFAVIDPDPCEPAVPEKNQQPLTYRLALYDGDEWIELKNDAYLPPDITLPVDMRVGGHLNYITMTIKANTIELALSCVRGGSTLNTTAIAPRTYLGGFSAMHVGNGACLPSRMDEYVDNVALAGGVLTDPIPTGACCMEGGSCIEDTTQAGCENREGGTYTNDGMNCATANCAQPPGACCVADPTGEGDYCVDEFDQDTCENALGGTFRGNFTTCVDPDILCCPKPFADADGDLDVDQRDFAVFQLCLGETAPFASSVCECFNRDDTGASQDLIDGMDFAEFKACTTGPDVPMNLGSPPAGCTP